MYEACSLEETNPGVSISSYQALHPVQWWIDPYIAKPDAEVGDSSGNRRTEFWDDTRDEPQSLSTQFSPGDIDVELNFLIQLIPCRINGL
jgi:hypothetical protein